MKNPNAKILYTFYTKSLYEHIKLLISRFYRVYSEKDPDFINSIHIRHAWGGKNYPGVYYDACRLNRVSPLTLKDARGMNKFEYVCNDLMEKTNGNLIKEYDYVIMDEAQDFPAVFYWLCRKITRNDNLVWAYDQLQNILNVDIQDTKTLFKNKYGDEGIDLEKLLEGHPSLNNDIVLPVCYRNPREILMLAHSIGFGLYNNGRIMQILENADHWKDHGYEILQGACNEGEETVITRPEKNSPLSISKKYEINEIVEVFNANTFKDELEWICKSIRENLKEQLLSFTRSKAWLKITGIGEDFDVLKDEINKTINDYPEFKFIYPNKDSVKQHQRDLSKKNEEREELANILMDFAKRKGMKPEEAIKMFKEEIKLPTEVTKK